MKVLSVSHLFPNNMKPNTGTFIKERLKSVAKNINLTIVAPVPYFPFMSLFNRYKYANHVAESEIFDGLCVMHPRYLLIPRVFKFLDGYLYYLSMNNFFQRLIEKNHYDILDFQWGYPDAFAGFLWARRMKKKIILTVRGNESICYFERSIRKKMMFRILKHFDHIITVSSDLKSKVVNDCGVSSDKVEVIPNGIDVQKFYPMDKNESRKICNLESSKKYILCISRLSQEKGLDNLLRGFSKLGTDVELIIIGDGPLRELLIAQSKALNIVDRLHLIGEISHKDTRAWYNASDIFCLPSLWEGCPNVIIESLACGTPVVSTYVGGIPDLITSKEHGILVPPGDHRALSKALRNALDRTWNRQNISKTGSVKTWDHVASKVISVYEKVL